MFQVFALRERTLLLLGSDKPVYVIKSVDNTELPYFRNSCLSLKTASQLALISEKLGKWRVLSKIIDSVTEWD